MIGAVIVVGSILGIIVYGWLLYSFAIVVLQLTAFLAVAAVLVILAWIGWTMATTPPLEPIDLTSTSGSKEVVEGSSGQDEHSRMKTES